MSKQEGDPDTEGDEQEALGRYREGLEKAPVPLRLKKLARKLEKVLSEARQKDQA